MKTCNVCGSTIDDIVKAGSIGCPECYNTFKYEFIEALKLSDVSIKYNGTLPKKLMNHHSVLIDKTFLQLKLDKAIEAEEYEQAALYRDYLRVLNNGTE